MSNEMKAALWITIRLVVCAAIVAHVGVKYVSPLAIATPNSAVILAMILGWTGGMTAFSRTCRHKRTEPTTEHP